MNVSLRQKWAMRKTYKRVQKLWAEYLEVSDKDDIQLVTAKLNAFLDNFRQVYDEWSASGALAGVNYNLDRLYGDCTDVLVNLLDLLDRETSKDDVAVLAAMMNKALNVAELILKDEKYRSLVSKTPNLINTILELLERLDGTEAKKLALRVISTLGEDDEGKLEIGRHQGFKKILKLLLDGDPDLTSEIVKTLKHFLEMPNMGAFGDISQNLTDESGSVLKGIVGEKVTNILSEVRELVKVEFTKVFPRLVENSEGKKKKGEVDPVVAQKSSLAIPSREEIDTALDMYLTSKGNDSSPASSSSTSSSPNSSSPGQEDFNMVRLSVPSSPHVNESGTEDDIYFTPDTSMVAGHPSHHSSGGSDSSPEKANNRASTPRRNRLRNLLPASTLSTPLDKPFKNLSLSTPVKSSVNINKQQQQQQQQQLSSSKKTFPNTNSTSSSDATANNQTHTPMKLRTSPSPSPESSPSSTATTTSSASEQAKPSSQEILREFMRVQGTLKSLTSILKDAASRASPDTSSISKLEIMETICRLLFRDTRSQEEFKKMDGYTIFRKILDKVSSQSGSATSSTSPTAPNTVFSSPNASPLLGNASLPELSPTASTSTATLVTSTIDTKKPKSSLHQTLLDQQEDSKSEQFLTDVFGVFWTLAVDGNKDFHIGNLDVLELMVRISVSSSRLDVRRHAVFALQDLLSVNPLNSVPIWKIGTQMFFDKLRQVVSVRLESCRCIGQLAKVLEIDDIPTFLTMEQSQSSEFDASTNIHPTNPATTNATQPPNHLFNNTATNSLDLSPYAISSSLQYFSSVLPSPPPIFTETSLFQYIWWMTRVIDYFGIMLSTHNLSVLENYTQILSDVNFPSQNYVVNIMLRSVSRLIADRVARKESVNPDFLEVYLGILKGLYEVEPEVDETTAGAMFIQAKSQSDRSFDEVLSDVPFGSHDQHQEDPSVEGTFWTALERHIALEQELLLLNIVGLLVEANGRNVNTFAANEGFDTLYRVITCDSKSSPRRLQALNVGPVYVPPPMTPPPRNNHELIDDLVQYTEIPIHDFKTSEGEGVVAAAGSEENVLSSGAPNQMDGDSDVVMVDMGLWLLREYLVSSEDGLGCMKWAVKLLRFVFKAIEPESTSAQLSPKIPLSIYSSSNSAKSFDFSVRDYQRACDPEFQIKICKMVSSLFRKEGLEDAAKQAFLENGGMEALLIMLMNTKTPAVADACLMCLGDLLINSEPTKVYLGEKFGYEAFVDLLSSSCCSPSRMLYEIVLETSTVGNVINALKSLNVSVFPDSSNPINLEGERFVISRDVWPYIADILAPSAMFETPLPLTCKGNKNENAPTGKAEDWDGFSKASMHTRADSRSSRHSLHSRADNSSFGEGVAKRGSFFSRSDSLTFGSRNGSFSALVGLLEKSPSTPVIVAPGDGNNNVSSSFKRSNSTLVDAASLSQSSIWLEPGSGKIGARLPSPGRTNSVDMFSRSDEHSTSDSHRHLDSGTDYQQNHHHGHQSQQQKQNQQHQQQGHDPSPEPSSSNSSPTSALRRRNSSRNYGRFNININDNSKDLFSAASVKAMSTIMFRNAEAACMVLRLFRRLSERYDYDVQHDFFNAMLLLVEANPRNKQYLCENYAMRFFVELIFGDERIREVSAKRFHVMLKERRRKKVEMGLMFTLDDDEHDHEDDQRGFQFSIMDSDYRRGPPAYLDLLILLGQYHITPAAASLLFSAAYDPNSILPQIHLLRRSRSTRSLKHSRSQSAVSTTVIAFTEKPKVVSTDQSIVDMQMQIMYALEKIAERTDPRFYFDLDGSSGCFKTFPLDKFPAVKTGYTFSCWFKVRAYLSNEMGLLCYEDQNETSCMFELFFKSFEANGSTKYCLCLRTQHWPLPPEDFVFDGFDFAETGVWHHIVFAHSREGATLYVDGEMIQTYSSFNYPRVSVAKEKAFVGVVGRKGVTNSIFPGKKDKKKYSGFFCGQIGTMHFVEGLFDDVIAEKLFNLGPEFSKTFSSLGITTKEFINILPQAYHEGPLNSSNLTPVEKSSSGSFSLPRDFSLSRRLVDIQESWDTSKQVGRIYGGCIVHKTVSIKDVLDDIGGLELCYPFLERGGEQTRAALRIISCLLYKTPKLVSKFTERNGFSVLLYLLKLSLKDLTIEVFDVLFDIMTDGVIKNNQMVITNLNCLSIIVDLLLVAPESVQVPVMRTLTYMLVDVPDNLSQWRASLGVDVLFELFIALPKACKPFTLRALDIMLPEFTLEEMSRLFDFLAYEKKSYLETKFDVASLLFRHALQEPQTVERIRNIGGLSLLIAFLDSPHEPLRLAVLKMIGILMSSNVKHSKLLMQKTVGYDAIKLLLTPYPVSLELTEVLLGVALDVYRCETDVKSGTDRSSQTKSWKSSSDDSTQNTLVFPDVVRSLLELLKGCDNADVILQGLSDLKRILTPDNMKITWELNWVEWFCNFLQEKSAYEQATWSPKIVSVIDSIIQKMTIYDLKRKTSIVAKMRGAIAEDDSFQIRIVENVLTYFDKNPCIQNDYANDLLRNIVYLLRHLVDYIPSSSAKLYHHIATTVNTLACQNNPAIRTAMKSTGIFDIRDDLILHLLQVDLPPEENIGFISNFSFEMVADQPKFRDSNGLLFLLRMFHKAHPNTELQLTLGHIIINVFGCIEDNLRILSKFIDDGEVLRSLFLCGNLPLEYFGSAAAASYFEVERPSVEGSLSFTSSSDAAGSVADVTMNADDHSRASVEGSIGRSSLQMEKKSTLEEFLAWYYSSDPTMILRRTAIEQRIEAIALPIVTICRRTQEKVIARRNKREKQYLDRQLRLATSLNRALLEVKKKARLRIETGAGQFYHVRDLLKSNSAEMIKTGEKVWQEAKTTMGIGKEETDVDADVSKGEVEVEGTLVI